MEALVAEEMVGEVMELKILALLGEDEVGLAIQLVRTNDDNSTAPKNFPTSTIQGEALYNTY